MKINLNIFVFLSLCSFALIGTHAMAMEHTRPRIRQTKNCLSLSQANIDIGWLRFSIIKNKFKKTCHIEQVYIHPQHRGQGHGTTLLQRIETIARKNNSTALTLDVLLENNRAKNLYRTLGFSTTGTSDNVDLANHMKKPLSPLGDKK